jgi:glycine/D-amino acid oxidase-like deaminating enzyme
MPTTLPRRQLLRGMAQSAAALALAGCVRRFPAQELLDLVEGPRLPAPDFSLLQTTDPFVVGVRPHRRGGVRLEVEELSGDAGGRRKFVIHNYGHGGAGITLSWGCASIVAEHVAKLRSGPAAGGSVAILGSGVMGLTAATELRTTQPDLRLTIYSREVDPQRTTSFVAGGQFEPSGIYHEYVDGNRQDVLADYLRRAHRKISRLHHSGDGTAFGIAERKNYTLEQPQSALDVCTPRDIVPAPRLGRLPFERLRVPGREYTTWLMNPRILLPRLATDLRNAGVPFVQRELVDRTEVSALAENIIVNCTGYGARRLFQDENVIPKRGHLIRLRKEDPRLSYFFGGGCSNDAICYVFCRQDDIAVGGSIVTNADDPTVRPDDAPVFEQILRNARFVFDGRPDECVV